MMTAHLLNDQGGRTTGTRRVRTPPALSSGIAAVMLCGGIALAPVYVFHSGLPQPADVVTACFVAIVLFTRLGSVLKVLATVKPITIIALWLGHVIALSSIWYLLTTDSDLLWPIAYYIYNFLLGVCLLMLLRERPTFWLKTTMVGITVATALSAVVLLAGFDLNLSRQTGTFNNPNQLAYFGLLTLCIAVLIQRLHRYSTWLLIALICACSAQILLSFSLTATGALLSALAGIVAINWKSAPLLRNLGLLAIVLSFAGASVLSSPQSEYLVRQWEARWLTVDSKTDNVAGSRAYSRIAEYPEYLLAGAGEGALWRFGPRARSEIHSTPGTLVFSYGIPGLAMFLTIVYLITAQRGFGYILVACAPLLHALTHQGLRSSLFWIFLVVLIFSLYSRSPPQPVQSRCMQPAR